jgi:hypothetical protein
MVKSTNVVTYQTGVDVLGFPTYVQHYIICEITTNFIKPKRILTVIQKFFKQH